MVFFYESSEGYVIYMGADKYENEDLIRYGIPEDVWFHVDDLSSAHVYLRLRKDQRLEDVSPETIMECAQLVKANSIVGCKQKDVDVIYTRWRNLHKTPSMEVGAIGFHDRSKIKTIRVSKDNAIVNALNRTKQERFPDLAALQEQRAAVFRAENKEKKRQEQNAIKQAKLQREAELKLRSYESILDERKMTANTDMDSDVTDRAAKTFEDDFM